MVFYRKYRPQTLEDLIGQTGVKQVLKMAISSQKLSHAYLFCGPKGTGKTSTARILAKIVNCEDAGNDLPCNKCTNCISITEGSNLDVVEMDAASNRGIEDIRSLRDNIKLSPTSAKKKVYIIDEVHMLSNDAFNALLKTLEEPPAHVLFVLATTEVQKLPATILSRVQRLNFQMATIEEMREALQRVAKAEKIEITDEALLALAKFAGGSFRDGIKLLDQLSSFGKIDLETVEKGLGSGALEGVYSLLESIAAKDAPESLKKLVGQLDTGVAAKELNLLVLELLRQLLFVKNNLGEQLVKREIGEDKYLTVKTLADKIGTSDLIEIIDCFQKSLEQSRFASIPSLPLEVAVVEACGLVNSSQLVVHSQDNEVKFQTKVEPEIKFKDKAVVRDEEKEPTSTSNEQITNNSSTDIAKIQEKWAYILETVRQYNYSLEALLRTVKIMECSEKVIVIEVPYSFHQRILEAPKSKDLLESILADILGRSIKVTTKLGSRPVRKEELANVEVAADDEIVRIAAEIFNSETIN